MSDLYKLYSTLSTPSFLIYSHPAAQYHPLLIPHISPDVIPNWIGNPASPPHRFLSIPTMPPSIIPCLSRSVTPPPC